MPILGRRDASLFVRLDRQRAFAHQRVVKLADLVALRQIGVEIVLPVKPAPRIDLRFYRHPGAHRLADTFAVGHRQHAGHRRIDQADLRIGFCPEGGGRAGKQLGVGSDLGVDFEADHDLPFAGGTVDAVMCSCCFVFRWGNQGNTGEIGAVKAGVTGEHRCAENFGMAADEKIRQNRALAAPCLRFWR